MVEDSDVFQQALASLQRAAGLPVVFGGMVGERRRITLTEMRGTRTTALNNLAVSSGTGLGGKVLALAKPSAVADYADSTDISHEYDRPVLAESLRAVLAVPVVVDGVVRAVLYGAIRQRLAFGDKALTAGMCVGRELGAELRIRAEVARRLAVAQTSRTAKQQSTSALEEVREANAELRTIAHDVADPELRQRLLEVCARLSGGTPRPAAGVWLSPRELDVLSWVGVGCGNAETARRLGLLPETVKSYLRSAMHKLGTHNRYETVVTARRLGLLP
ncbi:helix-turn-helix transcriptional regulator [Nonomuraea pusilla]|uniref:helix-turn-helix transcriptional regulator n=1 Tax=Nonomuraea pusilla TaxID=46177 RepID=UPI003323E368